MGCTKETDAYDMASCHAPKPVRGQQNQDYTGDPVNVVTGSLSIEETDLVWPQARLPLVFTRAYDSSAHNLGFGGGLGPGWTHSWELRLMPEAEKVVYVDDRHVRIPLAPNAPPPPGAKGMSLSETSSGWTVRQLDGLAAEFDQDGRLLLIRRPGPVIDSVVAFCWAEGHIVRATGATGSVELHWRGDRIDSLKAPDGRLWRYGYDRKGNLIFVERPSGIREHYSYCSEVLCETAEREGTAQPVRRTVKGIHQVFALARPGENALAMVTNIYTSAGRVARQIDALGGVTRFEYNLYTQMTGVTDPEGWTTVYTSDNQGRTVRVRTPEGSVREHVFDDQGNPLASIEDGRFRTEHVTFRDPDWHLRAADLAARPAGNRAAYLSFPTKEMGESFGFTAEDLEEAYDENGCAPLFRDPLGRVTRFSDRDSFGNPRCIDWPDGERTLSTFDGRSGLLVSREQYLEGELVERTAFVLDALGNVLRKTDGPEPVRCTERSFDPTGTFVEEELSWTDDPDRAQRRRFFRDVSGHVVREEMEIPAEPGGEVFSSVEETGYDEDGNIAWQISAGKGCAFSWDAVGRLLSVRRLDPVSRAPGDWLERREYDEMGRLVKLTDAAGGKTGFSYDRCGRLVRTECADGAISEFRHDRDGRVTAETGPDGDRKIAYQGLTTTVTDDLGRVWTTERDAGGRLVRSLVNGCGETRTYAGRVMGITYADGAWERQGPGFVERGPHPVQRVEWDRDRLGRPMALRVGADTEPAGLRFWSWDGATGTMVESDPLGRSTQVRLDSAGRLRERKEGAATLCYTRNDAGLLTRLTSDDGSVDLRFQYDGDALVHASAPGFSERWFLDPAGRPLINEQVLDGDAIRVETGWDEAGRLTFLSAPGSSMSIQYRVDGCCHVSLPGRNATITRNARGSEVCWDDGSVAGRSESAKGMTRWCTETGGRRWRWSIEWDSRGRPGKQVCETPSGTSVHLLQYDAINRLVGVLDGQGRERLWIDWDERGNPLEIRRDKKTVARFEVDDADQITTIVATDGSHTSVEHDPAGRVTTIGDLRLSYDAAGRPTRVGSHTDVRCASDGSLAGWTRAGKKERVIWALGRPVRLPGGIDVFWLDDAVLACRMGGRTRPVWTDPWGSVVGMEGHQDTVTYSPFGEASGHLPLPLGFCGLLRIEELLDCRARLYFPFLGRFVQPDPEGVADDPNRYLYAHGNPLVWTDPDGRAAVRSGVGRLANLPSVENMPLVSIEAFRAAGIEVARTDIKSPVSFEKRGHYEHRDRKGRVVGLTYIQEPGWLESRPKLVHYDRSATHLGTSWIVGPRFMESRPFLKTVDVKSREIGRIYVKGPGFLESRPHLVSYTTGQPGSKHLSYLKGPGWLESRPHLEHYG